MNQPTTRNGDVTAASPPTSSTPSPSGPTLTNGGDEIEPDSVTKHNSKNIIVGSISSSEAKSDTGQLMPEENNKPQDHLTEEGGGGGGGGVGTADALKTPIDNQNNNTRHIDGHVAHKAIGMAGEEATKKDILWECGDGKEATFPNNGLGQEGSNTMARKRLLDGQESGVEEEEKTTGMNDKAVQCNSNESAIMLQDWKEMPGYLQFNPYVLTGYRPLQNVSECFGSLFYFHNETFNILTHGIPIVYILATVPSKLMWDDYRFLSWCHIVGSVAPWCGSFLYHLFMNVNRGETVYYTLLKLDMLGIWISQSFGALPMVTATVHCLNWPLKWLFIIMYSLLSIWGLYKAMCATSPWQRRLCFFLPFTMRVLLTMIRLTRFGGGNTTSMTHIFLQDAVSVAGGAIGAMHIPEKWFPGCMDYYLNSHNIMHVLVVLAVYSMHQATVQDLDWMSKAECLMGNIISLQEASTNTDL